MKELHDFDEKELFDGLDHILLFLRKLKHIELTIENSCQIKSVSITDEGDSTKVEARISALTGVTTKSYEFRFKRLFTSFLIRNRIFRKKIKVPERLLDQARGAEFTEIVLAFPKEDQHCPIYAFLPVESAGFKFIIHADFRLVTSRQSLHKNNPWNVWLRNKIADLFVETLQRKEVSQV
jgi:hypothetical protein